MMYLKAFLVGGVICALSQVLIDRTRLTPARILSAYVVLGVLLTGLGVWGPTIFQRGNPVPYLAAAARRRCCAGGSCPRWQRAG